MKINLLGVYNCKLLNAIGSQANHSMFMSIGTATVNQSVLFVKYDTVSCESRPATCKFM